MAFRARELRQYQESSDLKVAQAGIEIRTGRKWSECRGSGHHKVKATAKGAGAEHHAITTCRGKIADIRGGASRSGGETSQPDGGNAAAGGLGA